MGWGQRGQIVLRLINKLFYCVYFSARTAQTTLNQCTVFIFFISYVDNSLPRWICRGKFLPLINHSTLTYEHLYQQPVQKHFLFFRKAATNLYIVHVYALAQQIYFLFQF